MSLFGDNQTKQFYALKGKTSDYYGVKALGNDVRVMIYKDATAKTAGTALYTTDILNRKLVKHYAAKAVKPTYFRQWIVGIPAIVTADTTYRVYFYLENMLGFGVQDRLDRVAIYTTGASETTGSTVATGLKNNLDAQLNNAGPVKGDFIVAVASGTGIVPTFAQATANAAKTFVYDNSGSKYYYLPTGHTAGDALSAVTDKVEVSLLVVKENKDSDTYKYEELDMRMHTNPYAYNVTMSTAAGDGVITLGTGTGALEQKDIHATDTTDVYISATTKVLSMELYFLRNRADLYDLSKNFYTNILNNPDTAAADYWATIDIDYAFSDTQGYTYHSDKQLSIAVPSSTSDADAVSNATTIMNAILGIS